MHNTAATTLRRSQPLQTHSTTCKHCAPQNALPAYSVTPSSRRRRKCLRCRFLFAAANPLLIARNSTWPSLASVRLPFDSVLGAPSGRVFRPRTNTSRVSARTSAFQRSVHLHKRVLDDLNLVGRTDLIYIPG